MTNHPWPMDKPIEEIQREHDHNVSYDYPIDWKLVDYLLDRLKIAETERDEYKDRWRYDERNETF